MLTLRLIAVVALACAPLASAEPEPFTTEEQLSEWTAGYYLDPSPERLPLAVEFIHERLVFEEHAESYWPMVMFFGGAYASDEGAASAAVDHALASEDNYLRTFVLSSLWAADAEHCREGIDRAEKSLTHPRMVGLIEYFDGNPCFLATGAPATTALHLDMLWGRFQATGERRAVSMIIDALALEDEGGEGVAVAGAARWSLGAQARRHPLVLEIARDRLRSEDNATVRAALDEIVSEIDAE